MSNKKKKPNKNGPDHRRLRSKPTTGQGAPKTPRESAPKKSGRAGGYKGVLPLPPVDVSGSGEVWETDAAGVVGVRPVADASKRQGVFRAELSDGVYDIGARVDAVPSHFSMTATTQKWPQPKSDLFWIFDCENHALSVSDAFVKRFGVEGEKMVIAEMMTAGWWISTYHYAPVAGLRMLIDAAPSMGHPIVVCEATG